MSNESGEEGQAPEDARGDQGAPPEVTPPRSDVPWLGTKRFWLVAAAIVIAVGAYIVVQARRVSASEAFVAVVALSGPSQVLPGEKVRYSVLVRDRYGAAVPHAGVRIGFEHRGFTELGRGETGDGGDAAVEVTVPADFKEDALLVAYADAGLARTQSEMIVSPRVAAPPKILVSSDKPLYQPAQTIHVRALAMAGDKPVADRAAVVEIRTPDGTKVFREEKRTSAYGVVSVDFLLAEQVKLGQYAIDVTLPPRPGVPNDSVSGEHHVEVKRYALPKLKVTLEDVGPLDPTGPLRGSARAKWIFGEPVTKGALVVTLERGSTTVRTQRGQLDKDGLFRFELAPAPGLKPSQQARGTFLLRAKVDVEGGLKAEATSTLTTHENGEIKLEAFPEGGSLVGLVEQTVFVVASAAERKGIEVRAAGGPSARTDEHGIARVTVRPLDPDVEITARGADGETGRVSLLAKKEGLVIRPDHESYEAGATAHVRVVGALAGDRIAIRMTKGSEPLSSGTCLVANEAEGCEAPFALSTSVSGLVWIHAVSLPGDPKRTIRAGKRLVMVDGGGRDLALKVSPDKPVYAPRDVGAVTVDVTGAGGGAVKASLGIAVADEAVFALANVRPDLERLFFVVDQDYQSARKVERWSSGTSTAVALPASFDRTTAYDPSAATSVRATILAVLTTMPEAVEMPSASTDEMARIARSVANDQVERYGAFAILTIVAISLAAILFFGVYGVVRLRRAVPSGASDADRATFVLETRGLVVDWLLAVLAPVALAPFALAAAEAFARSSSNAQGIVFGAWAVLALLGSVFLLRGALRVRRTAVAGEARPLARAVMFLPAATFFGQLAVLLTVGDDGRRLRPLFEVREAALFIPVVIAFAVQITFGLLSVVRQTLLRPVTVKGRIWLLASRATFLGLPITLVAAILIGRVVVRKRSVSFAEQQMEDRMTESAAMDSDNKEGGTGTRAKGEEGSMGSPSRAPGGGGGARFGVMAGGEAEKAPGATARVRDFFPETLLWVPEIVTDDGGRATIKVPFADSITTWRFGLRAVSATGQLGSASVPLVVKQDFFVDAALPATLTQGDELAVPVTVYSYLDRAQDVAVDLEGDGMSAVGPAHVSVHLEPKEARGMRFTVRADKAGDRLVRIKASTPARADAQERKVIVVPNGLSAIRTVNGRVIGAASTDVELPGNAIDGGNDLYAKVYGGPLSQVGEGLDGVFHMPHGCFEQTSSTTYPSVMVLDFLQRSKAVSPAVEKKARGYISQGYQRIVSFEVQGGGFSLFGGSPADVALSAYGLLELSDMARVSSVDEGLLSRTRRFVLAQRSHSGVWRKQKRDAWDRVLETDDPLLTAYVGWALAAAGSLDKTPDPEIASVLDRVAKLDAPIADDPYALALRANALLAGGRIDAARPLCERLAEAAIRDDAGVHWTSKASGVLYSNGASLDVETTGLATHALALAGAHPDLRSGALDWLVRRRMPRGTWSTTQATVAAMRALLDEAKPIPKEPQPVTVLVDGTPAASLTIEPNARDVHQLIDLRRFATTGKHTVEVKAAGDADVSYQVVATHWLPWKAPERGSLGLEVAYAPNAVPPGSTTSCRVRLSWRGELPAVMPLVEVAIPPSFEVETDDLEALLKNPDGVQRYTVGEGKVTLYVTSIRKDKPLVVDLRLRALRTARVVAPASVAYLYYEPEVRTETAPVLVRAL